MRNPVTFEPYLPFLPVCRLLSKKSRLSTALIWYQFVTYNHHHSTSDEDPLVLRIMKWGSGLSHTKLNSIIHKPAIPTKYEEWKCGKINMLVVSVNYHKVRTYHMAAFLPYCCNDMMLIMMWHVSWKKSITPSSTLFGKSMALPLQPWLETYTLRTHPLLFMYLSPTGLRVISRVQRMGNAIMLVIQISTWTLFLNLISK